MFSPQPLSLPLDGQLLPTDKLNSPPTPSNPSWQSHTPPPVLVLLLFTSARSLIKVSWGGWVREVGLVQKRGCSAEGGHGGGVKKAPGQWEGRTPPILPTPLRAHHPSMRLLDPQSCLSLPPRAVKPHDLPAPPCTPTYFDWALGTSECLWNWYWEPFLGLGVVHWDCGGWEGPVGLVGWERLSDPTKSSLILKTNPMDLSSQPWSHPPPPTFKFLWIPIVSQIPPTLSLPWFTLGQAPNTHLITELDQAAIFNAWMLP